MQKSRAVLIDPTPEAVTDALLAARAAANEGADTRRVPNDPAKWEKIVRRVATSAEGFKAVRGGKGSAPASQVVIGWWTDAIGRMHMAVTGWRYDDEYYSRLLDPAILATRQPLWHCYPEHLFGVITGGATRWLAACGCGVVGPPAALAWMGDCCGPCHDRREEFGSGALALANPDPFAKNSLWTAADSYQLDDTDGVNWPRVSPDGRFSVDVRFDAMRVLDRDTGSVTRVTPSAELTQSGAWLYYR